jgi:UDP-N-acetyl-2-amino-2-deoxyglucuronate dehydrogenase
VESLLRVGLVGCGHVARRYPAAIAAAPRLRLHVVTDTDRDAARRFAHECEVPFVPSFAAFLSLPLDLVCICTPSDTHAALAEACIEAGRDVVVEHPLALRSVEGERLCRFAAGRNRRLFVVRQRRFLDSIQRLKRLLAARELGEIEGMSAVLCWQRGTDYYRSRSWRTRRENGGVVRNQASHFLDLLIYLFGEPCSASGTLGNIAHRIPVEDSFVGSVEFRGNTVAELFCTTAAPRSWTRLTVAGTSGHAVLSGKQWERLESENIHAADGAPTGDHAAFLQRVDRSLAGEPVEVVSGPDAMPELRTIEAIYGTARWDDARVTAALRSQLDGST